jgi:hypothetical protein
MEFRHKRSLSPKIFKSVASAGTVTMTVFCDVKGVTHPQLMLTGTSLNSER